VKPYVRIYADEDGESHFEDVQIAYHETDFVPPTPPVSMSSFQAANQLGLAVVPPGWHGDWHPAPSLELAIYLSGEGEIEASDGGGESTYSRDRAARRRHPRQGPCLSRDRVVGDVGSHRAAA
jgi:hypothetical protein